MGRAWMRRTDVKLRRRELWRDVGLPGRRTVSGWEEAVGWMTRFLFPGEDRANFGTIGPRVRRGCRVGFSFERVVLVLLMRLWPRLFMMLRVLMFLMRVRFMLGLILSRLSNHGAVMSLLDEPLWDAHLRRQGKKSTAFPRSMLGLPRRVPYVGKICLLREVQCGGWDGGWRLNGWVPDEEGRRSMPRWGYRRLRRYRTDR